MVDSRAWMMDHKPQKKWDARENLHLKTHHFVLYFSLNLSIVSLHRVLHLSSPVDLHVQLLLHFHLVLFTQVVKPSVGLAQVTFDEVELHRDVASSHRSAFDKHNRINEDTSALTCHTHLLGL